MRINRFVALASGISRRMADDAIASERVIVNGITAVAGQEVYENDVVTLGDIVLKVAEKVTIMLNKPVGYVVSRVGQGSKTVYDLLPKEYQSLKPAGRLDKDSSGLLLLTNDGELAHKLTHPSFQKEKVYEITLDKNLTDIDRKKIENGVMLGDGKSALRLEGSNKKWVVSMTEGRNRQIRRTFAILDYQLRQLHRTNFGDFSLNKLQDGEYRLLP